MALKKCKECGNHVSSRADKCPQCGAPIARSQLLGCGCLVVCMAVLAVAVPTCIKSSPKSSAPVSVEAAIQDQGKAAYYTAREAVRKMLKSPSTAAFGSPGVDDGVGWFQESDGVWRVSGWVDSHNSFGAMIRTTWSARMRKKDDENFSLLKIRVGDESVDFEKLAEEAKEQAALDAIKLPHSPKPGIPEHWKPEYKETLDQSRATPAPEATPPPATPPPIRGYTLRRAVPIRTQYGSVEARQGSPVRVVSKSPTGIVIEAQGGRTTIPESWLEPVR